MSTNKWVETVDKLNIYRNKLAVWIQHTHEIERKDRYTLMQQKCDELLHQGSALVESRLSRHKLDKFYLDCSVFMEPHADEIDSAYANTPMI
jgi:hypothetical protein